MKEVSGYSSKVITAQLRKPPSKKTEKQGKKKRRSLAQLLG